VPGDVTMTLLDYDPVKTLYPNSPKSRIVAKAKSALSLRQTKSLDYRTEWICISYFIQQTLLHQSR